MHGSLGGTEENRAGAQHPEAAKSVLTRENNNESVLEQQNFEIINFGGGKVAMDNTDEMEPGQAHINQNVQI